MDQYFFIFKNYQPTFTNLAAGVSSCQLSPRARKKYLISTDHIKHFDNLGKSQLLPMLLFIIWAALYVAIALQCPKMFFLVMITSFGLGFLFFISLLGYVYLAILDKLALTKLINAADSGDGNAQCLLGVVCKTQGYKKRDTTKAHQWLITATANGNNLARYALYEVDGGSLSKEEAIN